jgi:hypothetical protein
VFARFLKASTSDYADCADRKALEMVGVASFAAEEGRLSADRHGSTQIKTKIG